MEQSKRELLVARICSGAVRCTVASGNGKQRMLLIRRPTRDDMVVSWEVYRETFEDAEQEGAMGDEQLLKWMLSQGLWDDKREQLLKCLPREIESFKVSLFEAGFKSNQRATIRKALAAAKAKLGEVAYQRHMHAHLSCSGLASIARSRYFIGRSLYRPDGRPVFSRRKFWESSSTTLDSAMAWYSANRIDEPEYRDLVRNDPWRTIWSSRKYESSVFGVPAVDYTDEQRTLTTWSTIYSNAYEHPDCPTDSVIEDDDLFDGWMIIQRRKRDSENGKVSAEDLVSNEKIRNSEEVYLVAETMEDAKKIYDINDPEAKAIQRQRFAMLKEKGEVKEMDMPDTKQRFRSALQAKVLATMRGQHQ